MAKNGRRAPRSARPKQEVLEEMRQASVAEIEQAAEAYMDVRDQRMDLTKQEITRQQELLELMHKHSLEEYEFDDYLVKIDVTSKEKVKVNKKPEPE